MKPIFISIEGIEGVGKTTLISSLKQHYESKGREVVLSREPGGTILSEKIRGLLLDVNMTGEISPLSELFLFYASRFQNIQQNIEPALSRGAVAICDRYIDSSVGYQVFGRGMDLEMVNMLNEEFIKIHPDITLWLDAPVEVGMARARKRSEADRFENEKIQFFYKVREGFVYIHKTQPNRFKRIDATQDPSQVLRDAISLLEQVEK